MEWNVDIDMYMDMYDMNIYSGLPTAPTLSFIRQTNKLKTLRIGKIGTHFQIVTEYQKIIIVDGR